MAADGHNDTAQLAPSSRSTLLSLLRLAEDPVLQPTVLKDAASMGFLVYALDDKSVKAVELALQIFIILCENPANLSTVKDLPNIDQAINKAKRRFKSEVSTLLLVSTLANIVAGETLSPLVHVCKAEYPAPAETQSSSPNTACPVPKRQTSHKFIQFQGYSRKNKAVTFQFDGHLTEVLISNMRSALLKTRGVTSITFDTQEAKCRLWIKDFVTSQVVGSVLLTHSGLPVYLVVKDADGSTDRILIEPEKGVANTAPRQNLPDYLPEDFGSVSSSGVSNRALIDPDRAKSSQSHGKDSWIGSISTFLTDSFFW